MLSRVVLCLGPCLRMSGRSICFIFLTPNTKTMTPNLGFALLKDAGGTCTTNTMRNLGQKLYLVVDALINFVENVSMTNMIKLAMPSQNIFLLKIQNIQYVQNAEGNRKDRLHTLKKNVNVVILSVSCVEPFGEKIIYVQMLPRINMLLIFQLVFAHPLN